MPKCRICKVELKLSTLCSNCAPVYFKDPLPTGCKSSLSPSQFTDYQPEDPMERLVIRVIEGRGLKFNYGN